MKNLVFTIMLCVLFVSNTFAQSYKPFEWQVFGFSFLNPENNDLGNTLTFDTELRFHINDKFSLGVKHEWQFFTPLFDEPVRGLGVTTAYSLTGEYYFSNNRNKRAFVGLGIGMFNNEATTESGVDVGGTELGFTPRIGYRFGLLRFNAAYNHTFAEDFPNYLTLGVGVTLGGRMRK